MRQRSDTADDPVAKKGGGDFLYRFKYRDFSDAMI